MNDFVTRKTEDIVLGKFISYMNKALLHKRIDYFRHQEFVNRKEFLMNEEEWKVLSADDTYCSSFCYEYEKIQETFEDENVSIAFKKLTKLQRKVLYLNIIEEIPISDIGKILKISTNSVQRVRLRASNSLKRNLEVIRNGKKD